MRRELTDSEKSFIRDVAARLAPTNAARLLDDLTSARAESMLDDGSLVLFHIHGHDRPNERGQHTYPYEGTLRDADGAVVDVLLFADPSDRLFQLEFLRWGDGTSAKARLDDTEDRARQRAGESQPESRYF